jgi:hypothetical protein
VELDHRSAESAALDRTRTARVHGRGGALDRGGAFGHRAALFGLVALADGTGYAASTWWIDPPQTLAEYRASIALPPAPPPQRVTTPWYFDIWWTEGDRVLYWSSTRLIVHGARLVSGYAAVAPATRLDYSKLASLRLAGAAALFTGPRTVALPGALPRARMVASAVRSANPGPTSRGSRWRIPRSWTSTSC